MLLSTVYISSSLDLVFSQETKVVPWWRSPLEAEQVKLIIVRGRERTNPSAKAVSQLDSVTLGKDADAALGEQQVDANLDSRIKASPIRATKLGAEHGGVGADLLVVNVEVDSDLVQILVSTAPSDAGMNTYTEAGDGESSRKSSPTMRMPSTRALVRTS